MPRAGPPRFARALLARLLPRHSSEFVLGDLEEMHARRTALRGRLRADAWYWRAAVSALVHGVPRARVPSWGGVLLDARAAARSLRRTPGFVLVASGTLALGLGVTIAVYALADQLVLRPPAGVHDADRAVYIEFVDDDGGGAYLSPADVADFRAGTTALVEQLAAVASARIHVAAGATDPIGAQVGFVDGPWFELLGVRALAGRLPRADELTITAPWTIAVISERLWSSLFARDPRVVGASVRINGRSLTVVGVTADGFAGLQRDAPVDVWVPSSALVSVIDFDAERLSSRQAALYPHLVGRLRAGIGGDVAAAGLRRAAERIARSLPDGESTLHGNVPRLHAGIHIPPDARVPTRAALRILAVVVALVLVVACANVANLLLFRSLRGRQDVAVRRALGASRMRIVVQQMIANGLLALGALVAALGVAWTITRAFAGRTLLGMPAFDALTLDAGLVLFACVAAAGAALLAGALPAWVASRGFALMPASAAGARTTGRHDRLRGGMTVVQLTASLALIVAALLLLRTVRSLYAVDPGYALDGVHVVSLEFPATYDDGTRMAAFARAELAVSAVPGVEGVALDDGGPLVPRLRGPVVRSSGDAADRTFGIVTFVTPAWFDLMDVRVVRGRAFGPEDRGPAGVNRVILGEGLARTLFGGEDPIGRTIRAFGRRHEVEVIGVAEDIRYARILSEPEPVVYHPWVEPMITGTTVLLYRAERGAGVGTAAAVRAAILRADPQLAVEMPVPLGARLDAQLADHRLFAQLLALLSMLAAALAGVGLYGVVAYGVADRAREFGIRMALGARAAGIARLVLRQTVATVLLGAVSGLAAAVVLARGLADRLHGVGVLDPLVYLAAVIALAGIAALACVGPVRSATKADPMAVLREE